MSKLKNSHVIPLPLANVSLLILIVRTEKHFLTNPQYVINDFGM
jgi:hypothetical protein